MDPLEANEAFNRVDATMTKEEQVKMPGVLKGILLESWRFDFLNDENHPIGGKIDESVTKDHAIALMEFFNKRCAASLVKTITIFRNGRVRTSYKLKGLAPLSEAKA
jgi:hypothetical protein